MRKWNFYLSGILYGVIEEADKGETDGDGRLYHRQLDVETGELTDLTEFTDDSFYYALCKRNLLKFFKHLSNYQDAIFGAGADDMDEAGPFPKYISTLFGEHFTRREKNSYIQRRVKFPMDLFLDDRQIYAAEMTGRDYTAVLVLDGMEDFTILKEWKNVYPQAPYTVRTCETYMVPTRDGERLATDVYLPGGAEKPVPTVLIRTPYGKGNGAASYYRFVQRGYGVVIQDVRGREDSTGPWIPNYFEVEDGDDTLNWIADQPWSDGQVGMTGGSYLGYVQWAAAASGNPHLKAILSSVCAGDAFVDLPRRGGCFASGMLAWAFAMTEQRMRMDLVVRDDWDQVLNIRPIRNIPRIALGHEAAFIDTWLAHKDYDDFWKRSSWKERSKKTVVPALIMSGWFDDNGMGTTQALELVREFYPQGSYKVILGPWMHSGNANYDLHCTYLGEHALRYDMDLLCFQWLEHFLKGVENQIEASAPVEYYTLGDHKWKTAACWPVPSAVPSVYYLDGPEEDAAAKLPGAGGTLTLQKPSNDRKDSYDYDPEHPAVHIIDMSENELEVPEDYTLEERRPDVLCYSTPVLEQNLTVTGEILATLYISSDCPDTDFVVRLTDVSEHGTSVKLADGVISAKYRNGFETPQYMVPGCIYEVKIRTTKISNTFKKGHRLRFTVTSSAKNFIFPNSNTKDGFNSRITRIAHNTIHCGGSHASNIVLPVE